MAASTLHSPEHCPPPPPPPPLPPPPFTPPHLPRLSTGAPLRGRPTHPESRSPPHKIPPLGRLAFPQQLCTLEETKEDTHLPHNYDVEYCFEG